MELNRQAAGPYIRALISGLERLAPNQDQVPLDELRGHLQAMDPSNTGALLAPYELDADTGLPAYSWMERVAAEAKVLLGADQPLWTEEEAARARRMDPDLGERLTARAWLQEHLHRSPLVPSTRLRVQQRSQGRREAYLMRLDRQVPRLGWLRVSLTAEGPAGWGRGLWHPLNNGTLEPEVGLEHLLSRHAITPLTILHQTLEEKLEVWIPQLSRGLIGPFWFPGNCPNTSRPPALESGLVLQMSTEQMGTDVQTSCHRDPLQAPLDLNVLPPGQQLFQERRFAVSRDQVDTVKEWARAKGAPTIVVAIDD